jgi:hypothetical protein
MLNTTKRITTPTRVALLALGAISLSSLSLPARAGDDAPDAGAKNPSTCRDVVNKKCLMKPNDGQSSQNQDTRNQDKAAAARQENRLSGLVNSPGIGHYDSKGNITSVEYPKLGFSDVNYGDEAIIRVYTNGQRQLVYVTGKFDHTGYYGAGNGGGAPGHTGPRSASSQTKANVAAARSTATAAVPTPIKSTTFDKTTNTTTRDYRTGATAAAGGPAPAAAIASKPTAEQLAAQSGTRDHRRK